MPVIAQHLAQRDTGRSGIGGVAVPGQPPCPTAPKQPHVNCCVGGNPRITTYTSHYRASTDQVKHAHIKDPPLTGKPAGSKKVVSCWCAGTSATKQPCSGAEDAAAGAPRRPQMTSPATRGLTLPRCPTPRALAGDRLAPSVRTPRSLAT